MEPEANAAKSACMTYENEELCSNVVRTSICLAYVTAYVTADVTADVAIITVRCALTEEGHYDFDAYSSALWQQYLYRKMI
jgi:hypothetical protein